MSLPRVQLRRVGLADAIDRGRAVFIPRSGLGGGGEYGALINDVLRTFAILREPVAYRMVFTVAQDTWRNWFNLKLKEGEEKASDAFDQQVQEKLSILKAKMELDRMAVFERAFGYAILVLGYVDKGQSLEDPLTDPKDLLDLKAYSKTQISSIVKEKDTTSPRYGLPKIYNIARSGLASRMKIHHSRVIHFASRLLESDWEGISVLDAAWDDIVTLRNERWGMGQTLFRTGAGFFDLTFTNKEQADIQAWVDAGNFENISNRAYFAHNQNATVDLKGMAGKALDPMNYYLPVMEHISCVSGIPLAILRGVQAGALTGSQVNEREYYGFIGDQQAAYEDGLRTLINIILRLQYGEEEPPDYSLEWKSGFELTEEQKVDIELRKAQMLRTKGAWMTVNEIRALEDPELEELPPGVGDQLAGKGQVGNEDESYLVSRLRSREGHSPRERTET